MPFPSKNKPKRMTTIAIGLGPVGPMGEKGEKKRSLSERNHAQETPDMEREFHEEGGAPRATPESVGYHDGSETCGSCEYFEQGGKCVFLAMDVDAGGHCQRFEAKTEDAHESNESQADEENEDGIY